ncbi:F-box only protein 31-like [Liolophura sinensis]|uniref:F-box only protein 31-like n=1 Tax=Liolophura sinensis TaxID=3198878 RepID=UPI0031583DBB
MASLKELPPELLSYLLSYLPGTELPKVCKVCRKLRDAVAVDLVWQTRCNVEYRFVSKQGWEPASFYDIYTKVLHKYGSVVGLWQPHIGPYGGLTYVKYERGQIVGYDCQPPREPDVKGPLRLKPLFSITLNGESGEVEQKCHKGYGGPHKCNILLKANPLEGLSLEMKCLELHLHQHPGGRETALEEWILEETDGGHHGPMFHERELLIIKFHILMQLQHHANVMTPIKLPCLGPAVKLVDPGLYKGNYGSHGIELILLTYQGQFQEVHGMKITGDPNVPASEISITADLRRPMILTEDQQDSVEVLGEIDTPDILPGNETNFVREQPFKIPQDCIDRYRRTPKTCRARFHGFGRIAGHGYTNPSSIPGHWIVFDEHNFGFIWLDLRSFSMFSKVTETFDIQPSAAAITRGQI